MKWSTFLMGITVLALACSAASAQGGAVLGFLANDGVTQYCDYEEFLWAPLPFASGVHVFRECGSAYDGNLVGFKGNIAASSGLPVTGGEIYLLAESGIDASCDCFSGDQAMLITRTTPVNPKVPEFGWQYLVNTYDAFNVYLTNWGYLTATIPGEGQVAKGATGKPLSSLQAGSRNNNLMTKID
ncbi:MAG: hypothetical protein ABSD39_05220 [Terriglobales bacterium]|jgi:hypothetical protein